MDTFKVSNRVIKTDKFTELPISTKLLYFYLISNADEYGQVNDVCNVTKQAMCSLIDLKLLALEDYVIFLSNNEVVVADWDVHNSID